MRIFSYLPNPRVWKAQIAAEYSGAKLEVIGAQPPELQGWLWDFDARELSDDEVTDSSEPAGEGLAESCTRRMRFSRPILSVRYQPHSVTMAASACLNPIAFFAQQREREPLARLCIRKVTPTGHRGLIVSWTPVWFLVVNSRFTCCRCQR